MFFPVQYLITHLQAVSACTGEATLALGAVAR